MKQLGIIIEPIAFISWDISWYESSHFFVPKQWVSGYVEAASISHHQKISEFKNEDIFELIRKISDAKVQRRQRYVQYFISTILQRIAKFAKFLAKASYHSDKKIKECNPKKTRISQYYNNLYNCIVKHIFCCSIFVWCMQ